MRSQINEFIDLYIDLLDYAEKMQKEAKKLNGFPKRNKGPYYPGWQG